jgi:cell wall-associated NlpC family hydrolase
MRLYRIPFFCALVILTGCANIKVAIYDQQQRQAYADQAKKTYLTSSAAVETTTKTETNTKANSLKHSMVQTANQYLGSPYSYGGMDPKKGFDCSGFVCTVAKKNKITLPRSSSLMAKSAPHIPWKKATSGDLVFFGDNGRIHHVGIIEKNREGETIVIHSTNQRGVISENVLASAYWRKRILFAIDIESFKAKEKV